MQLEFLSNSSKETGTWPVAHCSKILVVPTSIMSYVPSSSCFFPSKFCYVPY